MTFGRSLRLAVGSPTVRAKEHPGHEPRNGLLMCPSHHVMFDGYYFFLRFVPQERKFVLVNHSDQPDLRAFHGKAIGMDMNHKYAPFPSSFIIHEMRVRGFHPFQVNIEPAILNPVLSQDWITVDGVIDSSGNIKRDGTRNSGLPQLSPQSQIHPTNSNAGGTSSGTFALPPLNANTIGEILAATRALPSWKACEVEGTSWAGTTDENIKKYVADIGVGYD